MHFSAVVFYAASIASAYTILRRQAGLPPCGQTCYVSAFDSGTKCNATDIACQCLDANFLNAFGRCVATSCSAEDVQTAQAVAVAECKAAGVDLTSSNPLPACAVPCDQKATSATCPVPVDATTVDVACYCKDAAYIQTIDSCFKSSCTGQDLTIAETVGSALCRAYGVDISSVAAA